MDKHDLWESIPSGEERFINFAVLIVEIVGPLPKIKAANHFAGQILLSGTFPALAIRQWRMKVINQKSLILVLKSFLQYIYAE